MRKYIALQSDNFEGQHSSEFFGNMASLHTDLRTFDARDSWESLSRELEKYFEVNGVPIGDERVAILLTVLSPSVYEVLVDSCRPELPRLKTYAELSELLKIHHSPQPSVFKQRIKFFRATQTPAESVNDWLGRITSLAASCDFGNQFDTVLKVNFVSGLANRRLVRKLCEKTSSATLGELLDLAENHAQLRSAETNIMYLPDDVLRQIILLLTARERVPLSNSCRRLKTLVFEDPELLRHLDFSKRSGLTKMTHIQPYFESENACQHVRRVDASNVYCVKAGKLLNDSIGRAVNLVEVNIHSRQFKNVPQLRSFLKPLQHLKKLSIDWPTKAGNDIDICRQILQSPFSKLTYLSVRLKLSALTIFTSSLSLCHQLKELYMESLDRCQATVCRDPWNSEIKQLTNLKIIRYCGQEAIRIKEELATVLPDPARWTDFQQCGAAFPTGFYIEKDVEVCKELLQSKRLQDFLNTAPWENFKLKWALNPECLLKEVLRITHADVPEDLCCLSTFTKGRRHLLKVEEAKLLLKDPRYQISYLHLNHELERRCDAHLLASAFPNLSELVLDSVTRNLRTLPEDSRSQRRLSKRCNPTPRKQDDSPNMDSSFKMLVDNTPNIRRFRWEPFGTENWDLGELHLISGWQNLETLHMTSVPCDDGQFLIEIGKRCKNLQQFCLMNHFETGAEVPCNKIALIQMLEYCRNLRNLTLKCDIDQAEIFATLAKNVKLERVVALNFVTKHFAAPWISSFENMIRRCVKLTTINCDFEVETENDLNEVVSAVERIKGERHRPDSEIKVTCSVDRPGGSTSMVIGTASRDFPRNEPFPE